MTLFLASSLPRIIDSWHAACKQLKDQYGLRSAWWGQEPGSWMGGAWQQLSQSGSAWRCGHHSTYPVWADRGEGVCKNGVGFFSMKNIYYENLSEKRIKARRGTTASIISTGWCFAEKLFPSSWQTRHPNPNKDPYCLTPFSLKHLGIVVTESWFLHSGPLPVINGVITRLLTPVTYLKKSIYIGYKWL